MATTTTNMTQTTQMTEVENRTAGSRSKEPVSFKEVVEESLGLPYHEVNFITGKGALTIFLWTIF